MIDNNVVYFIEDDYGMVALEVSEQKSSCQKHVDYHGGRSGSLESVVESPVKLLDRGICLSDVEEFFLPTLKKCDRVGYIGFGTTTMCDEYVAFALTDEYVLCCTVVGDRVKEIWFPDMFQPRVSRGAELLVEFMQKHDLFLVDYRINCIVDASLQEITTYRKRHGFD